MVVIVVVVVVVVVVGGVVVVCVGVSATSAEYLDSFPLNCTYSSPFHLL